MLQSGKIQVDMGDVVDARLEMRIGLHFDPLWYLTEQMEKYRYIVRSEVPDHIDIASKEPQVQSLSFDGVDFAQITTLDQLAQLIDRRAVLESVADHHNAVLLLCELYQLFGLRYFGRQGFLDEDVFAV